MKNFKKVSHVEEQLKFLLDVHKQEESWEYTKLVFIKSALQTATRLYCLVSPHDDVIFQLRITLEIAYPHLTSWNDFCVEWCKNSSKFYKENESIARRKTNEEAAGYKTKYTAPSSKDYNQWIALLTSINW